MPDIFVLTMLSRPLRIGDTVYNVAWDCELNRAVIQYVDDPVDLMSEFVPIVKELKDENENEMSFGTELDAHRYLLGLQVEREDDSWRTL